MPLADLPPFFYMNFTDKDGNLTRDGYLYLDQQFQTLNNLVYLINHITTTIVNPKVGNAIPVTINGINPPLKTSREINSLVTANPITTPIGTIWYDSDMKKLRFLADIVAGVGQVETIQSLP